MSGDFVISMIFIILLSFVAASLCEEQVLSNQEAEKSLLIAEMDELYAREFIKLDPDSRKAIRLERCYWVTRVNTGFVNKGVKYTSIPSVR